MKIEIEVKVFGEVDGNGEIPKIYIFECEE